MDTNRLTDQQKQIVGVIDQDFQKWQSEYPSGTVKMAFYNGWLIGQLNGIKYCEAVNAGLIK